MKSILATLITIIFLIPSQALSWGMDANDPRSDGNGGWASGAYSGDVTPNDQGYNNQDGWSRDQQQGYVANGGYVDTASRAMVGMSNFGADSRQYGSGEIPTPGWGLDGVPFGGYSVDESVVARSDEITTNIIEYVEKQIKSHTNFFNRKSIREEVLKANPLDTIRSNVDDYVNGKISKKSFDNRISEFISNIGRMLYLKGGIKESFATKDFKIHNDSNKIVANLLRAFNQGPLNDSLARIGFLGVSVYVLEGSRHSFYSRKADHIFLSKDDIDRYGVVALYHELLHAGLYKAKKAGAISSYQFNQLSLMNKKKFSNLNGYVGSSQGLFEKDGYGYQEAFITGWIFDQITTNLTKIRKSKNIFIKNAENYRNDILNNIVIDTREDNNKKIRMVTAGNLTKTKVKQLFTNRFSKKANPDSIRVLIDKVMKRANNSLPNMCHPGSVKVVNVDYSCSWGEAIYPATTRYYTRTCKNDYKYSSVVAMDCGPVLGYKGP